MTFRITIFLILFGLNIFQIHGQSSSSNNIQIQNEGKILMTPEKLWEVKRVSGLGITLDGQNIIYKVTTPIVEQNGFDKKVYITDLQGLNHKEIQEFLPIMANKNMSPDGNYRLKEESVKLEKVFGVDFYPDLPKSTAQVYDALDYRHWDTWSDGTYRHLIIEKTKDAGATSKDILDSEPYHCPQKTFGGDEDYCWAPDSKSLIYVCKKEKGTSAAQSTNTDIYQYDIASGITKNLTAGNVGYDTHPTYSVRGELAYLSMDEASYESDKNDLKILRNGQTINLTAAWDETVLSYIWSNDGNKLFFTASVEGTLQVFEVPANAQDGGKSSVKQITNGDWDVNTIVGQSGDVLVVSRLSMNHAAEIFTYHLVTKTWKQITFVNQKLYEQVKSCKTERRYVNTTDGKKMLVWIVYPPDFDKSKKYPALLYCQGGPQSALTQFYSFRWNLHLMASQGYIVVAPNRRGMPGHGVEWNRQISKDWGGQNIKDYLSAIDDVARESYVDPSRLAAVGASYGGFSVFYLAGVHNKRFKTFIAHDGIFNTQSMYGTTEEMFFVNYDLGGPYWHNKNLQAYTQFNPSTYVDKWDTPILIVQGEKDYRVPIGQGLEAFTAAQLKGLKSKLLYLPDENHWVIKPQNSLVWQREFFKWLKETL